MEDNSIDINKNPIRRGNDKVKINTLEFLYELYLDNNYISDEDYQLLKEKGYIKEKLPRKPLSEPKKIKTERDFTISHHSEQYADKHIEIEEYDDDEEIVVNDETELKPNLLRKAGTITKADWMPSSIIYHTKDFVNWIDSIINDFSTRINYPKFNLYCQQADDWYAENGSITQCKTFDEKRDYKIQEYNRCKENALYFANKYLYLQEDVGRVKYYASEHYIHQRIICYLSDCKYSFILGKPRQVGGSSILGGIAVRDLLLNQNYYTKFITKNEEKGVEIFDDKIKYAYSQLPEWWKPQGKGENDSKIIHETNRVFEIGIKIKSGSDKGINSKIHVVVPTKTAINGGTPAKVIIDEADDVRDLSAMILEGNPTMFKKTADNKLIQVRQLIMLSTGTSSNVGGDFESEYNKIYGLWQEREFTVGIIPLFFNWTTRCDEEEYLSKKKLYYGGKQTEKTKSIKESILQFHQHYPSNISDMFKKFDDTLIPQDVISENLEKIKKCGLPPAQYGYFQPLFDRSVEYDETSDVPYKVIGAEWMPCDELDEKATTVIFQHPKRNWINRYYHGTDPISAATGLSKMASAIWDEYYHTVSAVTNIRVQNDTSECFLQSMLLGMYYGNDNKPLPELVERNISEAYVRYKERKGLIDSLVINSELQEYIQTGDLNLIGIDNKGKNNSFIIEAMKDIVNIYGTKIYLPIFWKQHQTFVKTINKEGKAKYGTKDNRVYNDDVLFAVVYAYLCAECFNERLHPQEKINGQTLKKVTKTELAFDNNNQLYYKTVYV